MINTIPEPTYEQMEANTKVAETDAQVAYACWYPQMGGYGSKCVVVFSKQVAGDSEPSCFDALIWHDGEFPFSDRDPIELHHCSAEQFVKFGNLVYSLQALPGYPENQVNDFGLRHEDDTCPAKDTQKDTDTVSLAKRLSTLLKAARAYLYDHQDTEVASLEAATQALNDINVTLGCDCEECESDDIAEAAIEFDALRLKYAQLKKLYDVRMEVTQQSVYKAKYSMECAESKARGLQQENAELKKTIERVRKRACDTERCESSEILALLTDGLYP